MKAGSEKSEVRSDKGIFLCLLCSLLFTSCTFYGHEARSKNGNYERDILVQVGGTASHRGADGSSFAVDNQASFQQFLQAAGIGITTWSAAHQQAAKYAFQQYQEGQITKRAAQKQLADLQKAELAAKGKAYDTAVGAGAEATVGTVTPP